MLYALKWEDPFICVAIDLASVDVIELVEALDPDYPRHKYVFNFYKADANDAILSFNVSGIAKQSLIAMWQEMLELKDGCKSKLTVHE